MAFVDGANLNKSAESLNFRIDYKKLKEFLEEYLKIDGYQLIRPYYYTADDMNPTLRTFFDRLEEFGYDLRTQEIVERKGGYIQKGVDIQLAVEMLSFGFHNNYDAAVLCSGDQDFLPVIKTIKDLGKLVYVVAFGHSCAEKMKRIPDKYIILSEHVDEIKRNV
ncbi:MAG: NYN domain-containing protein [Halobacteriota archaeon]